MNHRVYDRLEMFFHMAYDGFEWGLFALEQDIMLRDREKARVPIQ